ncbi:MAG TPA: hypothetical protein P5572_07905 [Phycisphaerae bacterium]|nr:hypothetical protein [Phycisphaerae bacterium]
MTSLLSVRRSKIQRVLCGAALLTLCALAGCTGDGKPAAQAKDDAAQPIVKSAERGPVKLTVSVNKGQITIAERLDLKIAVEAGPGIEVKMPEFGDSLAEFQIRDFHEEPVRTDADGTQEFEQDYNLDIFLSGDYTIPGITAKYRKTAGAADAEAGEYSELTTEPITVKVTSLLKGEFNPQDFHGVKPVAQVPVDRSWGFITGAVAAGVVGLVGLIVAIVWLVRRGRRPAAMVQVPPDEWALAQLRALADAQLVEQRKVQEFYYRLNEIARHYLELRFGLMAPERTTEEFLLELRGGTVLSRQHQDLLEEFLEACDLVKYARHEPGNREIEAAFNAARDLVLQTRPAAAEAAAPVAAEPREVAA